jgi:ribonuclease PH
MSMRASGRAVDELREVAFTRDYTQMANGSVLVEFGRTRVYRNEDPTVVA